jgi:hypothetical protein
VNPTSTRQKTPRVQPRAVLQGFGTVCPRTLQNRILATHRSSKRFQWPNGYSQATIHGYKAHAAADTETGLLGRLDVTPGNVHDGRADSAVVPDRFGAALQH